VNDLDPERLGRLMARSVPDLRQPPDRLTGVAGRVRRGTRRTRWAIASGALATAAVVTVPVALNHDDRVALDLSAHCSAPDGSRRPPPGVPIPHGFRTVAVISCGTEARTLPDGRYWIFQVERRADGASAGFSPNWPGPPIHRGAAPAR
jgi:hypothetical protein